MKYLISFILVLLSFQSFAADDDDWYTNYQVQIHQNKQDYSRRVYGYSKHIYDEGPGDPNWTLGSSSKTLTKHVVVEDVPSKQKVGKVILNRAKSFRGGIAGVLGGAAATAIIEAVDWVFEEGTFVKYKTVDGPYAVGTKDSELYGYGDTREKACQEYSTTYAKKNNGTTVYSYSTVGIQGTPTPEATWWCYLKSDKYGVINPSAVRVTGTYIPNPEKQKIKIDDTQVGGIATGDYQDPVDSTKNINTKQYDPTVADAYRRDPTGIDNTLADEMEDRIKNAPPTEDGQPAPPLDPRYSNPPQEDQRTNDRSWGDDISNEATGDTTPDVDPETGQQTGGQSISLQFPVFCEWAHKMCKWYDDWKSSDTVYKEHMTKTEEHQTEEKSFWQKVSDWFDWTKEEPEPDEEQEEPDIDDQGIFDKTFDTAFSLSKECPADIPFSYQTKYISGEFIFSLKWLCIIFTFLGYPLVFASHCVGVWILYEAVTRKQINWR
ncbi:MAG: hypothetical protein WBG77_11875 [Acinetobacter venetianus]|uniref:hypothetical protein n=1 Tax=Acinetobacter venetianus TaxID=52133 RepID=UPI003C78D5B0